MDCIIVVAERTRYLDILDHLQLVLIGTVVAPLVPVVAVAVDRFRRFRCFHCFHLPSYFQLLDEQLQIQLRRPYRSS